MRRLLFIILIISTFVSFSAFSEPNAMDESGAVDIAEGNLRIVLNTPANGKTFPAEMQKCDYKLESAMRLLNLEMRAPGLLSGKYKDSADGKPWGQYGKVKELFKALEKKYSFFYKDKANCDKENDSKAINNISNTLVAMNEFNSIDVAEGNLRIVLNTPANGKTFPAEMQKCDTKLESAMGLLNLEMRLPGLLSGKYKDSTDGKPWNQYQKVKELFKNLETKYEFFYKK